MRPEHALGMGAATLLCFLFGCSDGQEAPDVGRLPDGQPQQSDRTAGLDLLRGADTAPAVERASADGSGTLDSEPQPDSVASVVIGPAGGAVKSPDGLFELVVPSGALVKTILFSVTPTSAPPGNLGPAYDIGPTGTVFEKEVILRAYYAGFPLGSLPPDAITLGTVSGGKWKPISSAVDQAQQRLTAEIDHLSIYGILPR